MINIIIRFHQVQQDALDKQVVKFINTMLLTDTDSKANLSDVLTKVSQS